MASIGSGFESEAIEQDPGIAQIQAAQFGAQSAQQQVSLPATGFVASINGEEGPITIQPGTSTAGATVVVTNGLGTISIGVTIPVLDDPDFPLINAKCTIDTVPPAVTDDFAAGYNYFSQWIDESGPDIYACVDPANGAAVWVKLN